MDSLYLYYFYCLSHCMCMFGGQSWLRYIYCFMENRLHCFQENFISSFHIAKYSTDEILKKFHLSILSHAYLRYCHDSFMILLPQIPQFSLVVSRKSKIGFLEHESRILLADSCYEANIVYEVYPLCYISLVIFTTRN